MTAQPKQTQDTPQHFPDGRDALNMLARSWAGAAVTVNVDGRVIAASPQSGIQARMAAPFKIPGNNAGGIVLDSSNRAWRISENINGVYFAVMEKPDQSDEAAKFTASVSHEIRTPLNGILGMAALLEEEGELSPAQREYAEAIRKSGARLLDLLNNVLDYSRIEAGDIPLDYIAFDPEDLVQDVAELLAPRAHAVGLDLSAIVHPKLPKSMNGDPGRLRQILFNLAGNAIKFTESGGILLELTRGPDGSGMSMIIRDTGLGIPQEAKARLFDAFSQARAGDANRDGGVGLGLAIVAHLVKAMNGTIHVTSEPGHGAMFRVDIPLQDGPKDNLPAPDAANDTALTAPPTITTDKPIWLDLPLASALATTRALNDAGLNVHIGENAKQSGYSLAIIDAAHPPTTISNIAKNAPTVVVLRPEDRARIPQFRKLGCAGYLIRPLRAASIIERTRVALEGGDADDETEPKEIVPGTAGHVLIADDNGVNTLLASRALVAAGFRVDIAGTGAEALERVAERNYDLIFMDIRMPVMDGLEATRRIRAMAGEVAKIPIIAVTADIDPDLENRAEQAGVSQLAAKPIDPPRLRALAERWAAEKQNTPEDTA